MGRPFARLTASVPDSDWESFGRRNHFQPEGLEGGSCYQMVTLARAPGRFSRLPTNDLLAAVPLVFPAFDLRQNVCGRQNDAIRGGLAIHQLVAGRERLIRVHRADGQFTSAATQVGLNVGGLRDGGGHRSVFQGPLLFRRVNHTKIVNTRILLGCGA